jgi:hypothetical protein
MLFVDITLLLEQPDTGFGILLLRNMMAKSSQAADTLYPGHLTHSLSWLTCDLEEDINAQALAPARVLI